MVGNGGARRIEVYDGVFGGAKTAIATTANGRSNRKISTDGRGANARGGEAVSTLGAGGELGVDEAGCGLIGRRTAAAAERGESGRVANRRIVTVISDFSRVNSAQRRNGGGFIGRNPGLEQIRNSDRGDDENDRDDDE